MFANRTSTAVTGVAMVGLLSLAAGTDAQVATGAAKAANGTAPAMQQVTSRDGTKIAYEKSGKGPALIVVTGALATRSAGAELAQLLSPHFTVYSYDRRGRGDSGDTLPYAVAREVEDLATVIKAAGGTAYVYGKSSGAALALEAASTLGDAVRRLAIYEAPYSEAESAAKEWRAFTPKVDALLAANRRGEAVATFMTFVGTPADALAKLKASPAWLGMEKMAPTLAYDNAVLGADRSIPVERLAKITAPTLVMDGGASLAPMPFMRATAEKIANAIPKAERRVIDGQGHDVSAKVLAPVLVKFFGGSTTSTSSH